VANEEQRAREAEEATGQATASALTQGSTRAASARKAGFLGRTTDALSDRLSKLRPPTLDWRIFSYGLLALIALILIARNWAPVRIDLFGWHPDLPKAIAFIFFFVLGLLAAWLWALRGQRARASAPVGGVGPAPESEDRDEAEEEVA